MQGAVSHFLPLKKTGGHPGFPPYERRRAGETEMAAGFAGQ